MDVELTVHDSAVSLMVHVNSTVGSTCRDAEYEYGKAEVLGDKDGLGDGDGDGDAEAVGGLLLKSIDSTCRRSRL